MNILIIGSGAWGTSLAHVFSKKDIEVTIWSFEKLVADQINNTSINKKFLNKIKLNKNILAVTHRLDPKKYDFIFYVSPAQHLLSVLGKSLEGNYLKNLIICSKGIDIISGSIISDVLLNKYTCKNIHVLSGPSFAIEVANGLPTALSLGSSIRSKKMEKLFQGTNIRIYPSREYKSIQLLGSIKNSYAIGSGMIDGLQLGENARAAFITRAISELRLLLKSFKYNENFVESLAGIGDLILTCSSSQSRNYKLGIKIAEGDNPTNYSNKSITVNEGFYTMKALFKNKKIKLTRLPILLAIFNSINGKSPMNEMKKILLRSFKDERL